MQGTKRQHGQALVMTTLSLVAMCGMLGLAVDLGWAYFTRKSAQSAADAAALAAVHEALRRVGTTGSFICGDKVTCQADTACSAIPSSPPVNNLDNACLYAQRNGFTQGGQSGMQRVGVEADTTSPPPTVPGLKVYYWVTARVGQGVPQLFSAVLGNTMAGPSVRATAAVVDVPADASLILLNRKGDVTPFGRGVDLDATGGSTILAGRGVFMASQAFGEDGKYAGMLDGTSSVTAPFTNIRGTGTVDDPHGNWNAKPRHGFRELSYFNDPKAGEGQPSAPTGLSDCPILNGRIDGTTGLVGPGNYYAVDSRGQATAGKIQFTGTVRFTSAGSCLNNTAVIGGFGNYVFYGGMDFPTTHTSVTFAPGRYIAAGVKGNPGNVFSFTNQVELTDQTPLVANNTVPPRDAGEIFVFTDAYYPGLQVPAAVMPIRDQLKMGIADLQAGNNSETVINLHGLNGSESSPGYGQVPVELNPYRPMIFWQDQRNSPVRYTSQGEYDVSGCATGLDGVHAPSIENPCRNEGLANDRTPLMNLQATLNSHYYGALYQPRGAWLRIQGSSGIISPLQLITGAIQVAGGPTIQLDPLANPVMVRVAALVE